MARDLSKTVQQLQDYANEKGINMPDQIAITNYLFDHDNLLFSELDEYDAGAVLTCFEEKGHTHWINKATGQTDLTETEEGVSENGDKFTDDEGTEIIYLGDEPYEITPQKRKAYRFHDSEMQMGWIKHSFHLAVILKAELYKVAGYKDQREYAEYHLGESYGNMRKRAKNGNQILDMLPKDASMHLSEIDGYDQLMQNIGEIGPTKFYELTKFEDNHFDLKALAESGKATLPSGEEISIDDIKAQTAKQLSKKLKDERREMQKRIANLEEDKKRYRDERDQYRKELDEEKERIERSRELEEKYGKQAARMEEIDYLLEKTEDGLRLIENSFGKVEVDHSDPETLRERVMTLLRRMTLIQEAALTRYGWLENMDELSLFPAWKLSENGESTSPVEKGNS